MTRRGSSWWAASARSVSVAPFAELARCCPDDLAIAWIDSQPDVDTPDSEYPGIHAMVLDRHPHGTQGSVCTASCR
jgi:arginase family enzyme